VGGENEILPPKTLKSMSLPMGSQNSCFRTDYMVVGSGQKLLAESYEEINIKLANQLISTVDHA